MFPRSYLAIAALSAIAVQGDIIHYPPRSTNVNNLTFAFNGTGAPGIFNSSVTPDNEYGIYNWCNMPHVRTREYKTPSKDFTLVYVEVIHRHHKRTPYASNTFFKEDIPWTCVGSGPVEGAKNASGVVKDATTIQWQAFTDSQNPWTTTVGPGFINSTCQFPQLTADGLEDSFTHGQDLRAVYAERLGLGSKLDPKTVQVRSTNNILTSQVASGLMQGMFPDSSDVAVLIQSSNFDSLEPTYSCPTANTLRTNYTTGPNGTLWQAHLTDAASLYAKLDSVSGTSLPDTGGWHVSFDHYYDNMSAKQCHGKKLPCSVNDTSLCVTQEEADTVFRLGNWEYSYQFRDAPGSAQYSALHYGAWVLELKSHLEAKIDKTSKVNYFHNIAHDGSMSPLLGFLQVSEMVWPGMGAELVFELYSKGADHFLRVLWGGKPIESSTPLGVIDMVPIQDFFAHINSTIGNSSDLFAACSQTIVAAPITGPVPYGF